MNIVIFGANGPTGRLLTSEALGEGHTVTAVVRDPDAFPLRGDGLRVLAGDARDAESVASAVAGHDAVLSALGVPYTSKPIDLYSVATANLVRGMEQAGVRRIVVISSSATDPSVRYADTGGGFFFERVLKPIITKTLGRTLYDDMQRMEQLLAASDLDWTIVRPAGLFSAPAISAYETAEGHIRGRFTSRADLADLMLRALDDDRWMHRAVAVSTVAGQPTVLQLMRQEALKG
jgi:putative NADH-flavin reductase